MGLGAARFKRIAMKPTEDVELSYKSLEELPSNMAKMRCMVSVVKSAMPIHTVGLLEDVRSELAALPNPTARDVKVVAQQICAMQRSVDLMKGRTIPITTK